VRGKEAGIDEGERERREREGKWGGGARSVRRGKVSKKVREGSEKQGGGDGPENGRRGDYVDGGESLKKCD